MKENKQKNKGLIERMTVKDSVEVHQYVESLKEKPDEVEAAKSKIKFINKKKK